MLRRILVKKLKQGRRFLEVNHEGQKRNRMIGKRKETNHFSRIIFPCKIHCNFIQNVSFSKFVSNAAQFTFIFFVTIGS